MTRLAAELLPWLEYAAELGLEGLRVSRTERLDTVPPIRQTPPRARQEHRPSLETVREELGDCQRCGLARERNHIVFGEGNPDADVDSLLERVAGPLLGGPDLARQYLQFARLIDRREEIAQALGAMRRIAASLDGRPAQRWVWLANYLASFVYPEPPLGTE